MCLDLNVTQVFNLSTKQPQKLFHKKKVFLKISQHSQEKTCAGVSFLIKLQPEACNFIKKETLPQVFPCECCEIFKNAVFIAHIWWSS